MSKRAVWWIVFAAPMTFACGDSESEALTPDPPLDAGFDAPFDSPAPDVTQPDVGADVQSEGGSDVVSEPPPLVDAGPDAAPRTWTVSVLDESPGFKSRAAVAVGSDGTPHVAYNVATDPDGWYVPSVWYTTESNSQWTSREAAPPEGVSNEFPSVVVDSSLRPLIFFNRYIEADNQIDLFMVTGDGAGGFAPRVAVTTTATRDEFAPAVALDGQDVAHVIYQERLDNAGTFVYSLGYVTVAAGQTTLTEQLASASVEFSLSPDYAVAVQPDGTVHAVFSKPGDLGLNNVLYYRRRTATGWEPEVRLTETDQDVWGPAITVDSTGAAHVAYVKSATWDEKTLYYDRVVDNVPVGEQALSTSLEDRSYYLGITADVSDTIHIAFRRFYPFGGDNYGDVLYLRGVGGVFEPEVRITQTDALDESTPGIAVGPTGEVFISFVENLENLPHGKVYVAAFR